MQSSYFLLNDLRFHYLHWNLGEDGRPVVLLHGLASNARIWELVAPELVTLGFVPLAPDLRGHGLTDKPDGDYGFATMRRDILAFLNAAQLERPLLVGHSWGAMVALDFAAQFPIGPRAPAGLILLDGGVTQLDDDSGATWEQTRDRLAPPRLGGTPQEVFLDRLAEWTHPWGTDEQVSQIILANFELAQDETIWPRLTFERHMQIVRAMWEFKTYERLGRLRCPAEAILAVPPEPHFPGEAGSLERKKRGAGKAREALPGLKVHWMADTVHDIPLHRPGELAGLIDEFAEWLEGWKRGRLEG
jgi:pimeloyl-ACP methyl ester carboxylesterase